MKIGNVKCQIGNRELNKIKLLLTNLFLNENRKWWTEGNTILEIAKNLVELNNKSITNNKQLWLVEDLKIINPFWAGNKENLFKIWKSVNKDGNTIANASGKPKDKTLFERYNTIFGVDTMIGTISAQNNIIEMYKELGLIEQVNKELKEKDELKAAIVFTVFARLLDKELYDNPTDNFTWFTNDKDINLNLDGYLYYYLVNGNPATYSKIKCNPKNDSKYDTLLLFAHGGISLKFIETKDKTNNNKTSGTGHVNTVPPPKNSIPNKSFTEKRENEKILLKDKANRYTYEGKFANFSFLKKVDRKTVNKKFAMTFADFKKLGTKM
jgi:hypothetical protein